MMMEPYDGIFAAINHIIEKYAGLQGCSQHGREKYGEPVSCIFIMGTHACIKRRLPGKRRAGGGGGR